MQESLEADENSTSQALGGIEKKKPPEAARAPHDFVRVVWQKYPKNHSLLGAYHKKKGEKRNNQLKISKTRCKGTVDTIVKKMEKQSTWIHNNCGRKERSLWVGER